MNKTVLMSLLVAAGCLSTSFADTAVKEKAEEISKLASDPSVSMSDLSKAVYEAAKANPEGSDLYLKIVFDARSATSSSVELNTAVQAVLAAVPEVAQNFAKAVQAQMNKEVLPVSMTGSSSDLTTRVVNVVFSNAGVLSQVVTQQPNEPAITPTPVLPVPDDTSASF